MPVENENKYVLDVKNPIGFMRFLDGKPGAQTFAYRQGYLNENTRVREVVSGDFFDEEHIFTYKQKINGKLLEIETAIGKKDFDQLWTKVDRVMIKNRVKVPVNGRVWEVDFMKTSDGHEIYLVMAEVEMDEDETDPGTLPDFISEHLLYAVPRDDVRFINSRLTQPEAVKKLVQGIKDGKL